MPQNSLVSFIDDPLVWLKKRYHYKDNSRQYKKSKIYREETFNERKKDICDPPPPNEA